MPKNDTFLNAQMGDYRLQEIIAVGGMSRVYMGFDTRLERRAAVKVLELDQSWVDETIVQRFEREAKAVAALEHENIITIYQYGKHEDGAYFLAMQYIDGKDLRQILKEYRKQGKKMPVDRALHIMQQVASALDFGHKAGIIHRDIKPSNVLLTPDDKAVLTDFGLVLRPDVDQTLGTAFGTPRYIAPEQAVASQQAVPQSDVYSFAVILYEILTGETPFDGETPMEIALAHVSDMPDRPSTREPSVPPTVDDAVMKALSKEPNDRYATATEFMEAVAAGYNKGSGAATTPPPAGKPAPAQTNTSPAPAPPKVKASVPSPVTNTAPDAQPKKQRGAGRAILLLLLILVIGGGGAAYFVMNGGNTSNLPIVLGGGGGGGDIRLTYNGDSLVIHNESDRPLSNTRLLEFVRGAPNEGRDDFNADRIPGDVIPAGECFRLYRAGTTPPNPSQCADIKQEILMDESLFFWRTDPVTQLTFEVRWENEMVTRCDTVRANGESECRFNNPSPAEDE